MSRALLAVGAVVLVAFLAVGMGLVSVPMNPPSGDTMLVKFSAIDVVAGSQDATTSAIVIYRMIGGDLVTQETVTCDAAAKDSTLYYTTGEVLYLKLYDASDVSVCTQYLTWTVPAASAADIQASRFHYAAKFIDRGNTNKALTVTASNGTAVSATTDCSASTYNTNFATWELTVRALNDDTGYWNSYDFIHGYKNNHYLTVQVSGTGWDRVRFVNTNLDSFERNNIHYVVIPLDNNAVTRDKQSDGSYSPDGIYRFSLTLDLTAITTADDVSFIYAYRWYGDFDYFKTSGSWGADSAQTAATTIHIYP